MPQTLNKDEKELFLLEDDHKESYDEGFTFKMYADQIDAIRAGDVKRVENAFDKEMEDYYRQATEDETLLPYILFHQCGGLVIIASEGGLPLSRGAALSSKYLRQAQKITSFDDFYALMRQMTLSFTREVYVYKRLNSGNFVVNKCMQYIYEHIQEKISVRQLADVCGYSPSRLQHLFQKYAGCSLTDYIRREKIERACGLLKHTELSCAAISQKLSFASQSYFIRQFKRETGVTPARYRGTGDYRETGDSPSSIQSAGS